MRQTEEKKRRKERANLAKDLDERLRTAGREIAAASFWYLNSESGIKFMLFQKPLNQAVKNVFEQEGLTATEQKGTKVDNSKKNLTLKKEGLQRLLLKMLLQMPIKPLHQDDQDLREMQLIRKKPLKKVQVI